MINAVNFMFDLLLKETRELGCFLCLEQRIYFYTDKSILRYFKFSNSICDKFTFVSFIVL